MGLAIVSLIVLVILGALGGLLLFRTFGQAAARNENGPGVERTKTGVGRRTAVGRKSDRFGSGLVRAQLGSACL